MRRELEEQLWDALRVFDGPGIFPREWITQAVDGGKIGSPKQAWATLRKWGDWYDYGVCEDLGWKTIVGPLPDGPLKPAELEHRRGEALRMLSRR